MRSTALAFNHGTGFVVQTFFEEWILKRNQRRLAQLVEEKEQKETEEPD